VRLDDDVDELELCRERVEAVGRASVDPDDPHEVIPDVPLFIGEVRVVLCGAHDSASPILVLDCCNLTVLQKDSCDLIVSLLQYQIQWSPLSKRIYVVSIVEKNEFR